MPGSIESDDAAAELRAAITEADLAILELVNRRVELVQRLREHKIANDYPMIDPGREEWLITHLQELNRGPLPDAAVRTLAEQLIALTKAEIYGSEAASESRRAGHRPDTPGRG